MANLAHEKPRWLKEVNGLVNIGLALQDLGFRVFYVY